MRDTLYYYIKFLVFIGFLKMYSLLQVLGTFPIQTGVRLRCSNIEGVKFWSYCIVTKGQSDYTQYLDLVEPVSLQNMLIKYSYHDGLM